MLRGTGQATLEVLDSTGAVLKAGGGGPTNSDRSIRGFVAPTAGTYFVRVAGGATHDYRVIVMRDATFETERNDSLATATALSGGGTVVGSLRDSAEFASTAPIEVEPNGTVATASDIAGNFVRAGMNQYITRVDGNIANFGDADLYRFFASPGDVLRVDRFGLQGQTAQSVAILDRNEATVAQATGGFFSTSVTLEHTFAIGAYAGDYYIRGNNGITMSLGNYGMEAVLTTPQRILAPDRDHFELALAEGQRVTLTTITPFDGPDAPLNDLNPKIELFNSAGTLVASDDNGAADGRNARVIYQVPVGSAGVHRIRVTGVGTAAAGEYTLVIGTGNEPALNVVATSPAAGTAVTAFPTEYRVQLSKAVDPTSVQAGDLLVNGVPATSVAITDHSTLVFNIAAAAGGDGVYAVTMSAGAVTASGGAPLSAFATSFRLDRVHPTVVTSSINSGDVIAAGPLVFEARLSEDLARTGLGPEDVTLVETAITGASFTPSSFEYDGATDIVRVEYAALPPGEYTLKLLSGSSAFRDLAGLGLDGTGAGTGNADLSVGFTVDVATSVFSGPISPVEPPGSLVHRGSLVGQFHAAGDADRFTLNLDADQKVTVALRPRDASIRASLSVISPGGATLATTTAAAAGDSVVLQNVPAASAGTYTIVATAITVATGETGLGQYELEVVLNSALETETLTGSSNNSPASAQSLTDTAVALTGSALRLAVAGKIGPSDDYFSFVATAGQSITLALASHLSGLFGEPTTSQELANSVRLIESADFDEDGNADLIVATGDGVISLRRLDGTYQILDSHNTGSAPSAVAVGDIDRDGDLDVVIGISAFGGTAVRALSGRGDGTFDAPVDLAQVAGISEATMAIADVDGQLGPDLIVAGEMDIAVLLNQGTGTYGPATALTTTGRIQDLAVGDIDGDGDLDLAAATFTGSAGYYGDTRQGFVEVLLGNGAGGFGGATGFRVAKVPVAMIVGDFDDDGDDDVATAGFSRSAGFYSPDRTDNLVSVLLGTASGALTNAGNHRVSHQPTDLLAGDFDGDGDLDLVTPGNGSYLFFYSPRFAASVLLGRGDGTFDPRIDSLLAAVPGPAALGDLDGDGALDLVIGPGDSSGTQVTTLMGRGGLGLELRDGDGSLLALGAATQRWDRSADLRLPCAQCGHVLRARDRHWSRRLHAAGRAGRGLRHGAKQPGDGCARDFIHRRRAWPPQSLRGSRTRRGRCDSCGRARQPRGIEAGKSVGR